MDYLDIFWLVLMILMLVFELATVGLTTIWVAGGALAALIVALFNGPLWLQIVLFLAVTVARGRRRARHHHGCGPAG